MTVSTYECLKTKFGNYASWTLWDEQGKTESDTSGMNWADTISASSLNENYVFVALNWSVNEANPNYGKPWWNFHGGKNDYKLRFALQGTKFSGCYMTDLVKDFEEPDSNKVSIDTKSIELFTEEMSILGNPVLIALGRKVEKYLKKYFSDSFKIVEIEHYANYGNKETYKNHVIEVLEKI